MDCGSWCDTVWKETALGSKRNTGKEAHPDPDPGVGGQGSGCLLYVHCSVVWREKIALITLLPSSAKENVIECKPRQAVYRGCPGRWHDAQAPSGGAGLSESGEAGKRANAWSSQRELAMQTICQRTEQQPREEGVYLRALA